MKEDTEATEAKKEPRRLEFVRVNSRETLVFLGALGVLCG